MGHCICVLGDIQNAAGQVPGLIEFALSKGLNYVTSPVSLQSKLFCDSTLSCSIYVFFCILSQTILTELETAKILKLLRVPTKTVVE